LLEPLGCGCGDGFCRLGADERLQRCVRDARADGRQPVAPRHLAVAETLRGGRDRLGACHRGSTRGLAVFLRPRPRVGPGAWDRPTMGLAAPWVWGRDGRPNGIPQRAHWQPHLSALLELPGQWRRPVDETADRKPAISAAVVRGPLGDRYR